jgi:hypothetical protein
MRTDNESRLRDSALEFCHGTQGLGDRAQMPYEEDILMRM